MLAIVQIRRTQFNYLLLSLLIILSVFECNGDSSTYSCGLPDDLMYTNLEEGSSLELFCNLNLHHELTKGHDARDLVFLRDGRQVAKEFVEVVNATTIRLFEKNPPPSNSVYECLLHTNSTPTGVCLTTVVIGYKPREVLNFTCISNNLENLTCKWTKPENPMDTKYKLQFRLHGRAEAGKLYGCSGSPGEIMLQEKLKYNEGLCFWNLETVPMYKLPYEYYYFQMIGENPLGKVDFPWTKFHHYGQVILSPPDNLACVNVTYNSIFLQWYISKNVVYFLPGLTHRVEYQSTWDKDEWHSADTSQINIKDQSNHIFNLTGLQYANTIYDIRVYIKCAIAVGNDKWSVPATLTVRTKPTKPGAAPRTDIGSFEEVVGNSLTSRDVYVYWQCIPEYLKNGEGFHYKIVSVKEFGVLERNSTVDLIEITVAYARFKGLSLNSYNFTIVASNSEGDSGPAYVHLPRKQDMPPEPFGVMKIAYSPSLYELSWKFPPDKEHLIENYTIFWCNNIRDRPYQCPGFLNWTHVPKSETVRNITVSVNEIYQFAVSANTKYGSSGMVWASCTVIHNKSTGKMRSVWINKVGSDFIEVGWKFECSDGIGRVEKFFITYCPILLPGNNSTCKENETFLQTSPAQIHNKITGLKPYTAYRVSIAIETHSGIKQQSDLLYGTTLEGAPEPPRNVTVSNITNTSMVVSWIPPLLRNGVITLYKVCYGELSNCVKIDSNSTLYNSQFSYKIENMTSYKNYSVYIEACTTKCSDPSQVVWVQTLIGIPGIMERPKMNFINSSDIEVAWKHPRNPGGLLNLYQVAILRTDGEANRAYYYNSTTNKAQIPVCDVDSLGYGKYAIMVRAVNVDSQNKVHFGSWSDSTEYICYGPSLSKSLRTAIVVFGVLLITGIGILLLYAGKRIWLCLRGQIDQY